VLTVRDLTKTYPNGRRALRGVSLTLEKGSVLGLVGESGCGKSTLARLICALEDFQGGDIRLDGLSYRGLPERARRLLRRRVQMVFQDSGGSLDPRRTVFQALEEPLRNFRRLPGPALREGAAALLDALGLDRAKGRSYPHELSGGQRQRVVIARALAADPDYLICDEPVSSLDRENRERILEVLSTLREEKGLGCLFITHDLSLAVRMSRRVLVMREGRGVEELTAEQAAQAPCFRDPYTRSLFAAASYREGDGPC
jgi:ABC-type dipeptide/oligopeptide/nickel transport system ATPase subunit